MGVLSLLGSNGYVAYHRLLAHKVGPLGAIIIGELCNEYTYYESNGKLGEGGTFFCTAENLEDRTAIPYRTQLRILKSLEEEGYLTITLTGTPPVRRFSLNTDKILEACLPKYDKSEDLNMQVKSDKCADLNMTNSTTNKNKYNKYNKFSNENLSDGPTTNEDHVENEEEEVAVKKVNTRRNFVNRSVVAPVEGSENQSYTDSSSKDTFFGSIGKKQKKPSLYAQCMTAITEFTLAPELVTALENYLPIRLANKEKPLRGINQWKGMLNKLAEYTDKTAEAVKIVNRSTENGWATFVDPKSDKYSRRKRDISSECDQYGNRVVQSVKSEVSLEELQRQCEEKGVGPF